MMTEKRVQNVVPNTLVSEFCFTEECLNILSIYELGTVVWDPFHGESVWSGVVPQIAKVVPLNGL